MELLGTIREQLDTTDTPAAVLAAGWDAFELIQQVATAQTQQTTGSYATWMSAIPPACEGRDALARAPSMPRNPSRQDLRVTEAAGTDDEIADGLAVLAALLARRLRGVASDVSAAADQQAIERGAAAADEILELLGAEG